MPKAAFYTLGCRLNQTESAIMAKGLEGVGYEIIKDPEEADLCVINTCTVTNQSDVKCRKSIRAIQKKNPGVQIAVVGCFSQISSQQIIDIGGVHIVLGNEEKLKLHEYVTEASHADAPIVRVSNLSREPFSISTIGQHLESTRANLKVQDGCDFICSFCIIPSARGRSRPRIPGNIREEVRALAQQGIKELVLTGVNIGTYRYHETGFLDLMAIFEAESGIQRVRISSIEPTTVGPEIFALMKDPASKLLPYLHLPLQSGCDDILKQMRRRYLLSEYKDFVLQALNEVPGICIGSDIIVGFPGETDEQFEQTRSVLTDLPVHYFHVFPFAVRKGTMAEKLKPRINGDIISRRVTVLRDLSDLKKDRFAGEFLGSDLRVLFEGRDKEGRWTGYSENYVRVAVKSDKNLKNQIESVRLTRVESGVASGELADS
ncbi:MAG: tRNA (N(6)-L-threonylcarbamoyladenosine(37)-C(2))-methylthiotransferase MtaB [Deltaproteobacteria bacterium]|nr:tRNA (N(6)-L-threonylcarbamoyladenosine(37)-C(2))-methylthiotransferase MtaB [Deltaproteobacteria bacterium]MBT7714452.1 tRNA (N(6)-L-threonylcarbamoyladenosine(37)-C(2))-methylthiotransferase MtaB [Deltaproteobacteria bacterium]